jgi:Flp pilus assembly pilin Flp
VLPGGAHLNDEEFSMRLLNRLWNDDCGALIAMEFLFVATILVIGIVVGLTTVRNAVTAELAELGNAILALSQGYTIQGLEGCCSEVQGSQAIDGPGLVTSPACTSNFVPSPIVVEACQ